MLDDTSQDSVIHLDRSSAEANAANGRGGQCTVQADVTVADLLEEAGPSRAMITRQVAEPDIDEDDIFVHHVEDDAEEINFEPHGDIFWSQTSRLDPRHQRYKVGPKWVLVHIATFQCAIPEIEYYHKISSHAQI